MNDWISGWILVGLIGGALSVGAAIIIVLGGLTISWYNRRYDEVHGQDKGADTGSGE